MHDFVYWCGIVHVQRPQRFSSGDVTRSITPTTSKSRASVPSTPTSKCQFKPDIQNT